MYSRNKPVPLEPIRSETNQPDGADTCWSKKPGTLARSDLRQTKKSVFSFPVMPSPLSLPGFIYQHKSRGMAAFRDRRSGAVVSALILTPDWSLASPAGAPEIRWATLISRLGELLSSHYIKPFFPCRASWQRAGEGLIEGQEPFNPRRASCLRRAKKREQDQGWRSNAL